MASSPNTQLPSARRPEDRRPGYAARGRRCSPTGRAGGARGNPGAARRRDAHRPAPTWLAPVILDTRERLFLADGTVEETALSVEEGDRFRDRDRGLRLLILGSDRLFLVPDAWSASDSTLVVPLDDSVRVQFRFDEPRAVRPAAPGVSGSEGQRAGRRERRAVRRSSRRAPPESGG